MKSERSERFQSTPSAWRETTDFPDTYCALAISIHSLRMEGDISGTIDWDGDETFQSTPSAWRETPVVPTLANDVSFQSTPSAWRETDVMD